MAKSPPPQPLKRRRIMKKIIIILALLFSGIMANAQLSYKDYSYTVETFVHSDANRGIKAHTEKSMSYNWYIEFRLGDYVFNDIVSRRWNEERPEVVGGKLRALDNDPELWAFINRNKSKIEKKFNVKIKSAGNGILEVYSADEYEAYMAAKQAENNAKEEAKEKRLGSIL